MSKFRCRFHPKNKFRCRQFHLNKPFIQSTYLCFLWSGTGERNIDTSFLSLRHFIKKNQKIEILRQKCRRFAQIHSSIKSMFYIGHLFRRFLPMLLQSLRQKHPRLGQIHRRSRSGSLRHFLRRLNVSFEGNVGSRIRAKKTLELLIWTPKGLNLLSLC